MTELATFTRDGDKLISKAVTVTSSTLNIRRQLSAIHKRMRIDNEILEDKGGHIITYRHVIHNRQLGKLPNYLKVIRKSDDTYVLYVARDVQFLSACEEVDVAYGDEGTSISPTYPDCKGVLVYERPVT